MNTLYIIKWMLKDGFEITRSSYWDPELVKKKIHDNPEWTFRIVEANPTHVIWEAT